MAGRPKREVRSSLALSDILFLVARGKDFPSAVAEFLEKDASSTIKQFKILQDERLIKKLNIKGEQHNIKRYTVDTEGVIVCFLEYLKEKRENLLTTIRAKKDKKYKLKDYESRLGMFDNEWLKNLNLLDNQSFVKTFVKNEKLNAFFLSVFSTIILGEKTLEDIFDFFSQNATKDSLLLPAVFFDYPWLEKFSLFLTCLKADVIISPSVVAASESIMDSDKISSSFR
jgi:hypothetical protein